MFAYSYFVVAPIWGPRMVKGDERWDTLFFIAETLLPISAIFGTAIMLAILKGTSFRLRHYGLITACLAIMFLVWAIKPMISRLRGPEYPTPRFEWMPDMMWFAAAGLMAVTILSSLIYLCLRRTSKMPSDGITIASTGERELGDLAVRNLSARSR